MDENDKLPKNICIRCCTKLQTVCEFIDTARKAQETLLERSILLDQITSNETADSYMKKEIKIETQTYFDDESCVSEMEVSVDPMVVLQNSENTTSPVPEENSQMQLEDLTYLHGLDGETVTIKLIKKGDQHDTDPLDVADNPKKDSLPKPFPCVICKRSFLTELALKNHSWIHYNEDKNAIKDYKCSTCYECFEYKADLIAHLKEHRTNGTCTICGRV